jgi:cell pole-organizing protein PopZ
MEMEEQILLQMLQRLLAGQQETNARLERAEAFYAEMKADICAKIEARQQREDADAKARHEEAKSRHEKAEADAKVRHEKAAYAEMEATTLEANPEETEAAVERQDLFKEEINLENIGSSEDRCKDQRLAARRRRGTKKRSQDSAGSRQKSSAARKRVIRRAIPVVRKGNIRKGPSKDGTARGAPKGRRL